MSDSRKDLIALVGAPNSGKTTLYNWLTGSQFRTVNYPGATVEYSVGHSAPKFSYQFFAMDTPGTYSLFPKSADEEVTLKALYEKHELSEIKSQTVQKVILVVDGTQLERHLLIAEQFKQAGFSFLIVITMHDLLKKNGIQLKKDLIEKHFNCPVVLFDGIRGQGLDEVISLLQKLKTSNSNSISKLSDEQNNATDKKLQKLLEDVIGESQKTYSMYDQTARVDQILLHPFFGLIIFFFIMATLFSSIFWFASPFMDGLDQFFSFISEQVKSIGGESLLTDFMTDGLIVSFSSVLVFVPQIFILFLGIGALESTGYLARAATLIDKPFSLLGMSGRSFVPLLSSFACAVPAMMATRNISSPRDRMITNFILPLMTCSARLPVYMLLITFLFHDSPTWQVGLILAALYLGSLLIGAIAAGILNKILQKNQRGFFMMELPLYRSPRLKVLLQQAFSRTKSYVLKAGPVIFFFSVLIWAGTTFPNYQEKDSAVKLQSSYLAKAGQKLEPLFSPMGGDWRVGVGLMSAFAAREVFVSSLAVVFNITTDDEDTQRESLMQSMNEARNSSGQKIFTFSTVMGLIVFFMIALQCMSTVAIAWKESGSAFFAIGQLVLLNALAYGLAVGVVHGLRSLGVA